MASNWSRQGADWIDVGGESTRPGSRPVSAEEELRRVLPVIRSLRRKLRSTPISIDTTKAEVAEKAAQAGASILNDVSGLRFDPRLADVARRYKTPLILMHLRGRPETMQTMPFVRDIWRSLNRGLACSLQRALAAGLRRSQLILDPGLGFGKSRFQNFEILAQPQEIATVRPSHPGGHLAKVVCPGHRRRRWSSCCRTSQLEKKGRSRSLLADD